MLTIKLTEEEFAEATTMERQSELSGSDLMDVFIFDEYRLKAFSRKINHTVVYKVKRLSDDSVKITYKALSERPIEIELNVKRGNKLKIVYMNDEFIKLDLVYSTKEKISPERSKELVAFEIVDYVLALEDYIMKRCELDRSMVYKQATSKASSSKQKKNTSVKKEKVDDLVMLKDLVTYVSHSNIKHNIQCECWRVRGHYRHYKTGKVIFIREYKKGKNRNSEPTDKIYKLEG